MSLTDIRADITECMNYGTPMTASESADNDNVILVTDNEGNRYKLTIEKL